MTQNEVNIHVYPNPSTGKLNVKVDHPTDVTLKMIDLLGNTLTVDVTDQLDGIYHIDLSAIADGIYFIQVQNGSFHSRQRVIISNKN